MIVQIETTTACNQRCWFCQNAHYPGREKRVMAMGLFRDVVTEISRLYASKHPLITFAAYGEPTLDPHLEERLHFLKQNGLTFWFISNGTGLSKAVVDFIIRERIPIMNFHLNVPAMDPSLYEELTGAPQTYALRIKENLFYLFEKADELQASMTINVLGDLGAKHRRAFEEIQECFKAYPVSISFQEVMNRAGMLEDVVRRKIDHGTDLLICKAGYLQNLYVGAEGNLYLCCHDYYQESTFGSLKDTPLRELLLSPLRKQRIRELRKKFCIRCPYARPLEGLSCKLRTRAGAKALDPITCF
jgi:radical SAM protein with 4Fe4S-binding SPASM domain